MNKTTSRKQSASSDSALMIPERRTRTNGCIGTFLQLFHRKQVLSKQKLLSQRDNRTPNINPPRVEDGRGRHREMKAAGLVARLMGLDSLPKEEEKKKKKSSRFINGGDLRVVEEDMKARKGFKPGGLNADLLLLKNPVSSPESPRLRSSPRLIDAAAKILDPGGSRFTLTYSLQLLENVIDQEAVRSKHSVDERMMNAKNLERRLRGLSSRGRIKSSRVVDSCSNSHLERVRSLFRESTDAQTVCANEAIVNAEMITRGIANPNCSPRFIVDELETFAEALRDLVGENKGDCGGGRLVFDCLMEYLDTRWGKGIMILKRGSLNVSASSVMNDAAEQIRKWSREEGDCKYDEKWRDCERDVSEIGIEIGDHLLQFMLQEITVEIWLATLFD